MCETIRNDRVGSFAMPMPFATNCGAANSRGEQSVTDVWTPCDLADPALIVELPTGPGAETVRRTPPLSPTPCTRRGESQGEGPPLARAFRCSGIPIDDGSYPGPSCQEASMERVLEHRRE